MKFNFSVVDTNISLAERLKGLCSGKGGKPWPGLMQWTVKGVHSWHNITNVSNGSNDIDEIETPDEQEIKLGQFPKIGKCFYVSNAAPMKMYLIKYNWCVCETFLTCR